MPEQACRSSAEVSDRPRSRRRHAFTIVELLVVISILMLLIAMLLPALGRARRLAQDILCQSNQRQLATAFLAYTVDHNGRMMPFVHVKDRYWFSQMEPYGNIDPALLCPLATKPSFGSGPTPFHAWGPLGENGWGDGKTGSYGLNLWLLKYGEPEPPPNGHYYGGLKSFWDNDYFFSNITEITDPAQTVILGDSRWVGSWPNNRDGEDDLVPPDPWVGDQRHQQGAFMGRYYMDRHDMAVNLVFVDGHSERTPLLHLWNVRWHKFSDPKVMMP